MSRGPNETPTETAEEPQRGSERPGGVGCLVGNGMEMFSLGDTIRVELDLRDESGVSTVSATFYELTSGEGVHDARGEPRGARGYRGSLTGGHRRDPAR